jgi:uncharacterized protein YgbK (DUF1537 family)
MSSETSAPRSLDEVLAGQPPEVPFPADAMARCRASLEATGTLLVALDDDPTGSQVVHDVPVVTRWGDDDLRSLVARDAALSFVLTNSRALDRVDAVTCNRQIAESLLDIAVELGRRVEFVSRSDSTLRGHFPAETDTLADALRRHGREVDVLLLCPAFPEAGRITVDGTHWVRTPEGYVAAGDSEFAGDATFGYRSSRLADWVAERTDHRVSPAEVRSITLHDLRTGGADQVATILSDGPTGTVVAADAVTDTDLALLAMGVAIARERGRRILHRSGPSILAPLVGQRRADPLTEADLATEIASQPYAEQRGGGLTVVGSHTTVSTAQLEGLLTAHGPFHVELDVDAALDDPSTEIGRVVAALAPHRATGDVVVSTTRTRRDATTPAASLALARAVGDALVQVVRRTVDEVAPSYVVAKGGITSSTVATDALGVRHATVIGQMIVGGLPVWRLPEDSRCPGLPYVIFPGNVGDQGTLAAIVGTLRAAVARAERH